MYALSIILWEIMTDCVPFGDRTPGRAAQLVCEGGLPEIEVLKGMDDVSNHLCISLNGRRRIRFDRMQFLLREILVEDKSEVKDHQKQEICIPLSSFFLPYLHSFLFCRVLINITVSIR